MKIESQQVQKYLDYLRSRGESSSVINKKLKSIKHFAKWAKKRDLVIELPRFKFKLPDFNFEKFFVKNYLGLIILLVFMAALGAGIYNQFFAKVSRPFAYPSSPTFPGVTSGSSRILSFQGRLTDSVGNPITDKIDMVFKLYNVSTGGTALYTGSCTGVNGVTPDQDGIFNVLIGSDCGMSGIPSNIFTENPNVYLGITVGTDSEMGTRQQIANVGYALNAETLQGLPPGTNLSTIPYINSQGDLLIAAASPGLRSINQSANFVLSSANAITLTSAGTGNIVLQATGSGTLSFRTGGASDTYSRIFIENTGNVGIGTTNPGAYKLNVNGNTYLAGTLTTTGAITAPTSSNTINGIVINSGTISNATWNGNLVGTQYGGTGQNWSSVVQGSIPYFSATGTMATLAPGTSGYVLTTNGSGANPTWSPASGVGTNYWNLAAGSLFPQNNTVDLLIGGSATSSAKFAFINVNSGTPTASVSAQTNGSTYLTATGTLSTTQMLPLTLGSATTGSVQLSPQGTTGLFVDGSGNVGVGTTAPTAKLDVAGNILVNNGGSIDTRAAGTLTIGGTTQTGLTVGRSGATTSIVGSNITAGGIAYGASNTLTFTSAGTSGQPLLSGGSGAPTFGTLGLVYGGTNADLSGVAQGGLIYKGASALSGTGALTGILQGNGSSAPTAITGTANYVPRWSSSAPYLTSTSTIFDDGTNVGIGSTNPVQKLHVLGSCVTGDTLLPIRRRKKKSNSSKNDEEEFIWEYLLERIDKVLPGDEVLSLNEETGEFEYAKIKNLMDMGVQEIYEITTKSGKKIKTTGEHPYLTLMN
jgi:hypothetical protein